ncbi:type II toxin-antitoxin system VapC family toxin [Ideonella alba]|uniref:Type II toxin-antitoxin system VapC family toxin n=2 Tax=Ideonella alba TaxID=2824118 RepID=A0A940YHY0_9BURK|nr:type II toxin-antitoxin system VapC family toxin [Ideonella alba]MBQ0932840.1 type II toxin-antitoxin system VapC family toxin [Ideonella alba]
MLDTDTCIFLMRGESAVLADKVQSVPLQQQLMSAVTFAELSYGVQASAAAKRKQNQQVLDSLALHLAVLDWPQEAAPHYAEIRADLKRRGAQLGAADLMIAAHARALGATVVTNNVKDFGRVKGLRVENWTR